MKSGLGEQNHPCSRRPEMVSFFRRRNNRLSNPMWLLTQYPLARPIPVTATRPRQKARQWPGADHQPSLWNTLLSDKPLLEGSVHGKQRVRAILTYFRAFSTSYAQSIYARIPEPSTWVRGSELNLPAEPARHSLQARSKKARKTDSEDGQRRRHSQGGTGSG